MTATPHDNQTKSSAKQKGTKSKPGDSVAKKSAPTKPDEMTEEVLEFITAIDEYKREHSRQFPNWSEVLEILKTLGYSRVG